MDAPGARSTVDATASADLVLAVANAEDEAFTLDSLAQRLVEGVSVHVAPAAVALHVPMGAERLTLVASRGLAPRTLAVWRVLDSPQDAGAARDDGGEAAPLPCVAFTLMQPARTTDPDASAFVRAFSAAHAGERIIVESHPVVRHGRVLAVVTFAGPSLPAHPPPAFIARILAGPIARQVARDAVETLARERQSALERERSMSRAFQEFTEATVQEIREPLRSLATLAQYLGGSPDAAHGSEDAELAARILRLAENVRHKVARLEEVARIPTGCMPRERRAARDLVRAALTEAGSEKDARVHIAGPDILVDVHAEATILALREIVRNAFTHADASDPRVTIAWRESPTAWEFVVTDNGPGIEPVVLDRVRGVFHKGLATRDAPGAGVGFTLAEKAVRGQGGTLEVGDAPTSGARVVIALPKPRADA